MQNTITVGGGEISVYIDSLKVAIKFDAGANKSNLLASIGRIVDEIDDDHMIDGFASCSLSTGANYDSFLDSLDTISGIYLVEPYYIVSEDLVAPVGQSFFVRFGSEVTREEIDSINNVFNTVITDSIVDLPNVFTLNNTDSSGYRVLSLANTYYNLSETEFSHPNFGIRLKLNAPYQLFDNYAQNQDHIKRVVGQFNDSTVWDFAGLTDSIIVAVVDDGVTSHEDLPSSRILAGYDYAHDDSDATPGATMGHGMSCAGIIGASHTTDSLTGMGDSSGVISLNPNVRIVPIKLFPDSNTASGQTLEDLANGITEAWSVYDADVMSNSWSFPFPEHEFDVINYALLFAYLNGREGKGVPLIFSADNEGYFWCIHEIVGYPARLEACFAVAALKLNDSAWYYNTCGPEMDIAAPSGDMSLLGNMWSLDQMDTLGYNLLDTGATWDCPTLSGNDYDYMCHFGGTSGACPIVSGVASLILAKDPSLTANEVYNILRYSAQTELDWGTVTPPDYQYGYGRVDAFRAILSLARGDADNSDAYDISDLVFLVDFLFHSGAAPFPSVLLGDSNCDSSVDVDDLTYLIAFIFGDPAGPAPVKPCFEY